MYTLTNYSVRYEVEVRASSLSEDERGGGSCGAKWRRSLVWSHWRCCSCAVPPPRWACAPRSQAAGGRHGRLRTLGAACWLQRHLFEPDEAEAGEDNGGRACSIGAAAFLTEQQDMCDC
jgi:hypothetical protein